MAVKTIVEVLDCIQWRISSKWTDDKNRYYCAACECPCSFRDYVLTLYINNYYIKI